MDALTCFITDDRHPVQMLSLLVGADEKSALAMALDELQAHAHYRAIETWDGERRLFLVTRDDLVAPHG